MRTIIKTASVPEISEASMRVYNIDECPTGTATKCDTSLSPILANSWMEAQVMLDVTVTSRTFGNKQPMQPLAFALTVLLNMQINSSTTTTGATVIATTALGSCTTPCTK